MADGEIFSRKLAENMVQAPWTDQQVQHLNEYQTAGAMHPFTGINSKGEKVDLIATKQGWVAEANGSVVQDWAHDFMADGSAVKNFSQQREFMRQNLVP